MNSKSEECDANHILFSSSSIPSSHVKHHAGTGGIYGLGVIGALVYFIQHSTSFMDGLWGILQAFFWPAVVLYKVLEAFKL